MNLIRLVMVTIKRILKDPLKIGIMFIMPIAVILFVNFMDSGPNVATSNLDIAYNIEDNSVDVFELFSSPKKSIWTFDNEIEKALESLENNEVAVVYNIPANFSEKINNYEKPIIQSYKREEGNVTIPIEMEINNKINELIKEKFLIDKGVISSIDDLYILKTETIFTRNKKVEMGDMGMVPMMIIYFIILSASIIGSELIELKKRNIISRSITTPNSSATILGSLALALLFFQVGSNVIVLLLSKLMIGYDIVNLPIIIVNIILASLFSITLSLALTRLLKNETAVPLMTALIALTTMFLSMFAQEGMYKHIPKIIRNLGKFTPQYWIFDSLERSILLPNAFIVLLMILALFTAGSYKLQDFAKK